ncbi:hypothetical protein B0H19DRAFT_1250275 [Mycena capillaripes]|nr:hypothetical protein B0H19DRAFT_1250275 [Mycena capillaripes]
MAISLFSRDSPAKWILFRVAALNRASRQIRRMHLGPTLVSYRRSGKQPEAVSKDAEAPELDDFSVFEVEETFFKVHMSLFRLKIWSPADPVDSTQPSSGNISTGPVMLSDTAENFRFFLWDLQAFPHELSHLKTGDADVSHLVDRLLSITEMANKHRLSVLEIHALESLRHFVLSPYFHLASPTQHCRTLRIATSSTFSANFLPDLSRRLIHHILRRKSVDDMLLSLVEGDSRLQKIRGAIYYRQLIDMERRLDDQTPAQPVFLPDMDVERRMRFLAAHISLSALSERLCASAPVLPSSGCSSHSACLLAWKDSWASAVSASDTTVSGPADILGRLRAMMPLLKRTVSDSPTMSIDCGLAALEAVVTLRDDIIDGLLDHFNFA